jgi:hypothetical protein
LWWAVAFRHSTPEALQAFSDGAAYFRQLAHSEDDEDEDHNDQKLRHANAKHVDTSLSVDGTDVSRRSQALFYAVFLFSLL